MSMASSCFPREATVLFLPVPSPVGHAAVRRFLASYCLSFLTKSKPRSLKLASCAGALYCFVFFMPRSGSPSASAASFVHAGRQRPASGRQAGHVRKSLDKRKWSARFKFIRHGEVITFDTPVRALQIDAEKDREYVANAIGRVPRPSRLDAASSAITFLRGGKVAPRTKVPGSASTNQSHSGGEDKKNNGMPGSASILELSPSAIQNMNKVKLRALAVQTSDIVRNKRSTKGKWIPKTCKELRVELLALRASKSVLALPGNPISRKRRASSLPSRLVIKKTHAPTKTTPVSGSVGGRPRH